jgi:monoamine oxidase
MLRIETDVCVVGAGFAGLAAARMVTGEGLDAVVLEARDRVGGRTHTETLPGGTTIDHGGAWLGPGQDAAYGLAAEVGVRTYPTYSKGASVYVKNGAPKRYSGAVPLAMGPHHVVNLAIAMKRLDRMAAKIPLQAPWEAKHAARWDATTLGAWIDRNTAPGAGREVLRGVLKDLYVADPGAVSLLGALHLIRAHTNLDKLFAIEGGDQQDRVAGGMQGIADRVAAELGDAVRLGCPVSRITHERDRVEVAGDDVVVTARRVVVAVPVPLTGRIRFDPPLPTERAHLTQRMPLGPVHKISAIYDEPWWREDGLNATSLDVRSPASVTLDACAETAPPGVIAVIVAGRPSLELGRLDAGARRRVITDALAQRFGPKAGKLADYREHDWGAEDYSRGGYVAHMPPGLLTGFGPALRRPVGAIHWAGSETSTRNHGSIDGAITSGRRAATEAVEAIAAPAARAMAVTP